MRPLRLAVDARDLVRDERGIGTYARALLARYGARDDIQLTLLVRDWVPCRLAPGLRTAIRADRAVRCSRRVPSDTDVVWHPWNGTFFAGAAPAVATVHDLVPFAIPAPAKALRESQQAPFRRTASTAAAVICDSAFTATDVQRYLGVPANRLHVVPLGVDAVFSPGNLDALPAELRGRRFILYVGAHDPHKNVATLVTAYRRAFGAGDPALVFTRSDPHSPQAIVCERVTRATLVALYRGATLVVVPSVYEGFGLPVLEAMACGAPVLAARAAALPEAGGDAAAYVDDPLDADAWAAALVALVADPTRRAALAGAGLLRATEFPWERCAQATLEILRAIAEPGAAT